MKCSICNKRLSNKSALTRHNDSEIHNWNLLNPEHCVTDIFGKDVGSIINNFLSSGTNIFELIAMGNLWKAEDLIYRNKFSTVVYKYYDKVDFKDPYYYRELEFEYNMGDMCGGVIRSGDYELKLDYNMEKVWRKCSIEIKKRIYVPFKILAYSKFIFQIPNVSYNDSILILT